MNIQTNNDVLLLNKIQELTAVNADQVRSQAKEALAESHTAMTVDLSETRFLDSSGLGALVGLHKVMCSRGGTFTLLNPSPVARQLLDLTRLHRILKITNT